MSEVNVSGTWKSLVTGTAVNVSGAWKTVSHIFVNVSGVWKQAWISFTASASDSTPSGSDSGASQSGSVTSNVTTVTPSGGTGPYTYAWAQGPGGTADSGAYTPTAATSAACAWGATVDSLDVDFDEEWTCTVTDDDSNETTVTVTVELIWTDTS